MQICLRALLTALNLFPNCCAQLVMAKASGNKRTHAGSILETIISIYSLAATRHNSPSANQILKLCIMIEA
jgi:hypothetical protein